MYGLYVKDKNEIINKLPDYLFSKDLKGARVVKLTVDASTKEVVYDSNGNIATDGTNQDGTLKEGYTKKNEKVNADEVLTTQNYELAKKVMEKRLNSLGMQDYHLSKNDQTGEITLEIAESSNIDKVIYDLQYLGKFTITDSQTKEILLKNDDVEKAGVVYSTTESGTRVYLSIQFNKNAKQKLEQITKEYISTLDEEGKTVTKKISINLDDEQLTETYFAEPNSTGILQLSIGSASTDSKTIEEYRQQAEEMASIIDSGNMQVKYKIDSNKNLSVATNINTLRIMLYIIVAIVIIALLYLCIKHKIKGLLLSISYIGYIALLLIVLRPTNVIISLEAISGLVLLLILNYMFIKDILNKKEESIKEVLNQTLKKYALLLLPILLISIIFVFASWIPLSSLGMIMFWGLSIMFIYNYIVVTVLLSDK